MIPSFERGVPFRPLEKGPHPAFASHHILPGRRQDSRIPSAFFILEMATFARGASTSKRDARLNPSQQPTLLTEPTHVAVRETVCRLS